MQSLLALLRFRSAHPAFNGMFCLRPSAPDRLIMEWANGNDTARLDVDLSTMRSTMEAT